MPRNDMHVIRRVLNMKRDKYIETERPKKAWLDYVEDDMFKKDVRVDESSNRENRKNLKNELFRRS